MKNKLRAVVCGLGQMGRPIVWSMHEFGFDVVALDKNPNAGRGLPREAADFFETKDLESLKKMIMLSNPDIVISSLPYHQTQEIATYCIQKKYNYCDLGGKLSVSKEINKAASAIKKGSGFHIFTDLGLAPGWVNILAEHGTKQMFGHQNDLEEVKMMVGGIPLKALKPPLNYSLSWSLDGLINEYEDKCRVLIDGVDTFRDGMEGLEAVETKSLGELEAFYTSGGASHSIDSMKSKGVKDCSYKTLRYKGHCDVVKWLIRDCKLDKACLSEIFKKGCNPTIAQQSPAIGGPVPPGPNTDVVIMKVLIRAKESTWEKELLIPSTNLFSAMQKATAFPIASVAKMIAEDFFVKNAPQHRDYHDLIPTALSYKDIDYAEFEKNMKKLITKVNDKPYERD